MASENKHLIFFVDIAFVITILTCIFISYYRFVYKSIVTKNPTLGIISLIILSCICLFTMYVYHYFYLKRQIKKKMNEDKIKYQEYYNNCKKCVVDMVGNESFLAYYNLLTLEELLKLENSLECDDTVIIYTSHIDTEDEAEKTVKGNIEKGVIYNILYYDGTLDKAEKLRNMGYKNIFSMEQDENNFDYLMSKETASGFDLMFYKKKGIVEAYFCVNFSIGNLS